MAIFLTFMKGLEFRLFVKDHASRYKFSIIRLRVKTVKECDSSDTVPCRQLRSHYQGLTERCALIDMYLLMRRRVY